VSRYLVAHQGDHVSNDVVYVNQLPLRSAIFEEETGSADDFRRAGCVFDGSRRGLACLFDIGVIAVEPA